MANILRIYDFELDHKEKNKSVTFYDLGMEHPEIHKHIKTNNIQSQEIKWSIVLDAFKHKFSNDLNSEKLKNSRTKRIVKRGSIIDEKGKVSLKEINIDKKQLLIYSTLNGGKITENSFLEEVKKKEFTLRRLKGDRIYDELFFLLHISFRTNKARLFILTRTNNLNLDSTIKTYFEKNMFQCSNYNKSKWNPYIPPELKEESLNRTIINNISISKSRFLNSEELNDEFEIEIKLKSIKKGGFGRITNEIVNFLKKTHISIDDKDINDDTGIVKFNITDPETKTNKSVVFGELDNFLPKLAFDEKEITKSDLTLCENKLLNICLKYINYDETGLI